jgi:hypothetical protein
MVLRSGSPSQLATSSTRDGHFWISDQAMEGWSSSIAPVSRSNLEVLTGLVWSNALASAVAFDERHIADSLVDLFRADDRLTVNYYLIKRRTRPS